MVKRSSKAFGHFSIEVLLSDFNTHDSHASRGKRQTVMAIKDHNCAPGIICRKSAIACFAMFRKILWRDLLPGLILIIIPGNGSVEGIEGAIEGN